MDSLFFMDTYTPCGCSPKHELGVALTNQQPRFVLLRRLLHLTMPVGLCEFLNDFLHLCKVLSPLSRMVWSSEMGKASHHIFSKCASIIGRDRNCPIWWTWTVKCPFSQWTESPNGMIPMAWYQGHFMPDHSALHPTCCHVNQRGLYATSLFLKKMCILSLKYMGDISVCSLLQQHIVWCG